MIRQLRLSSGLVMLAYVTMHLLNHAVGLISLAGDGRRAVVHLPHLVEPAGAGAALRQLPRPLRAGAMGIVAAAQLAAAAVRAQPDHSRLCDPDPARPPRRRHAHLRQLLPHRHRLLRLSAVGLFRPITRTRLFADAGSGRRLEPRDDRPAFLAAGAALVCAAPAGRARARACSSRCCRCSA